MRSSTSNIYNIEGLCIQILVIHFASNIHILKEYVTLNAGLLLVLKYFFSVVLLPYSTFIQVLYLIINLRYFNFSFHNTILTYSDSEANIILFTPLDLSDSSS